MNDVYFVRRLYSRPTFRTWSLFSSPNVKSDSSLILLRAHRYESAWFDASAENFAGSIVETKRPRPETPVSVILPLGVPLYLPKTTTGRFANTSGIDFDERSYAWKPSNFTSTFVSTGCSTYSRNFFD